MQYDIPIFSINEALSILPKKMDSRAARVMMIAIGLQESRFQYRRQIKGPARGFYQFESGGGVKGVMQHHASAEHAYDLCFKLKVPFIRASVYQTLEHDDVLAAGFCRLLLWTDPKSLPSIGNAQAAWDLYLRVWRPGKPHRETWDELYQYAVEFTGD